MFRYVRHGDCGMLKNWRIFLLFALIAVYAIWVQWWASSDFPLEHQICGEGEAKNDCASYNIILYSAWLLAKATDHWSALVAAGATVAIAWFTLTLRNSTEKLFIATDIAAAAAKRSTEIVEEELLRTRRAWVGIHGTIQAVNPLTFDDSGARGAIKMIVKNGGDSPAIGFHVVYNVSIRPFPHDDPRQFLMQADPNSILQFSHNMGRLVLPNEVSEMPSYEFNVPRTAFGIGPNGNVSVWLTGYIGYRDEFDLPHATTFLFRYVAKGQREIAPRGVIAGQFEVFGVGSAN
jgi:hypothetical protein